MRSSFAPTAVSYQEPEILAAIGAIYDAAIDVTQWPAALTRVATLVDCSSVYLSIDASRAAARDPSDALWRRPWLWVGDASPITLADPSAVRGDFRPAFCLEIYRDKALRAVLAGRESVPDWANTCAGPIVQYLLPHFAIAVEIIARSDEFERQLAEVAATLDRFSQAIVVIDAKRRVSFTNRAAVRLCKRRDGVTMKDGVLCATTARGRDALRRLVDHSKSVSDVNCRSVLFDRESPKPPLPAFAIELVGRGDARSVHDQKFALFISDPDAGGALEERTLCELFQLTPTEARVAAALTDGLTLVEVSRQLGLAVATARWHLRHVFAKTHTSRQPELVNLLLRSLSAIDRE